MAISLNGVFAALALALGYLLGSIPFGLLLTRLAGTADLRSVGSGNIGATNVLRTGRKDLAAATLVLDALKATLAPLNYRNLDDIPEFKGQQTTTEFLSRHVFDAMADAARSGALGPGGEGIERIRVTLHESHVARAWFEGPVAR